MSIFSGPQGKGAMRQHRENRRLDAADRQAAFDHEVHAHAEREGISVRLAREFLNADRWTPEQVAEIQRRARETRERLEPYIDGPMFVEVGAEEKYLPRGGAA